jgi:ATP-binding cassette subfamily C (CFTR/MRP) protein 1
MTDGTVEKETKTADPLAEVNATGDSEPATPFSPVEDPEEEIRRKEESEEQRAEREELKRTHSHATDASGLTRTTTRNSVPFKQKPWYKTPNPLRWGGIPSVPTERTVSPEYAASFLSQLTFNWMGPLMNVSGIVIFSAKGGEKICTC